MNARRSLAIVMIVSAAAIAAVAMAQPSSPKPAAPAAAPASSASSASSAQESGNLRSVLEAFRSDFNTAKIRTINQVMKMSGDEAEKFWPIYRRYEVELAAQGDRRIALIRDFMGRQAGGTLDDKAAAEIADRWLTLAQDRIDLWKKYHKEIAAAVSPTRAAQFLQIEHQIALLIDINVASEMPLVGAEKPQSK